MKSIRVSLLGDELLKREFFFCVCVCVSNELWFCAQVRAGIATAWARIGGSHVRDVTRADTGSVTTLRFALLCRWCAPTTDLASIWAAAAFAEINTAGAAPGDQIVLLSPSVWTKCFICEMETAILRTEIEMPRRCR